MSRKKNRQPISGAVLPEDTGGLDLNVSGLEKLEQVPAADDTVHSREVPAPEGLTLYEAIQATPTFMAAAPTVEPSVVIVSNGRTFWAANREGLNPRHDFPIFVDTLARHWRPVVGNESGLRIE